MSPPPPCVWGVGAWIETTKIDLVAMPIFSLPPLLTLVSLLSGLFLIAGPADAKINVDSAVSFPMDARDQKLLQALAPKELAALNQRLNQAMLLYYNGDYVRALPLFEKIAARADTLDILYWYGMAAFKSRRLTLAVDQFRAMLKRHPELDPVRLTLAKALMGLGRKAAARVHLRRLMGSKTQSGIKRNAHRLKTRLDGPKKVQQIPKKRWQGALQLTAGLQYDDNINAQADDRTHGSLTSDTPASSFGHNLSGALDLLYDIGAPGDFTWRNLLKFYGLDHWKHGSNDYTQLDFSTALEHYGKNNLGRLSLGYVSRWYAQQSLSDSWYLAPEATFTKIPRTDFLKVAYRFEDESFDQSASQTQDNQTHTLQITPGWTFKHAKGNGGLSVLGAYAKRNAATSQFSYQEWGITPTVTADIKPVGLGFMLQGQYLDRDYDGNVSAVGSFLPPAERKDKRFGVTAMVSKILTENLTLSTSYSFSRNDSNTSLYDYTKNIFGLNLGGNWGF